MIAPEIVVKVRHLFFAEHWKIGTIASQLGLHHDTVRAALDLNVNRLNRARRERDQQLIDPYLEFVQQTLQSYPRLRATRIFQMIRLRGYKGSASQLRRVVRGRRPAVQKEALLQLRTFPGEQGQADWAAFGDVVIGRATRRLSCFVMTLSYSRALSLSFFFDQGLENLLRAHVEAFDQFHGAPRVILYDNMKQVVLRRRGEDVEFHPRLLELAAHWDRHALIEDPDHRQALLEEKRRAMGSSPSGRLRLAVPESEKLLDEAFRRGESIGRSTTRLTELLDDYGAAVLLSAIQLALERDTPRVSSVEWLLQQRRRGQQQRVRPVELDRRPDLADLHVQPHDSDICDHLSDDDED